MSKGVFEIKLFHYFLYANYIGIVFLSFYSDAQNPAFSYPDLRLFVPLVIFVIFLFSGYPNLLTKFLIKIPFEILFFYFLFTFIYTSKYILSIGIDSIFLYGFITTLVYYISLCIFNCSKALEVSIAFAKIVIVVGLASTVIEIIQLKYLNYEYSEIFNNAKNHYTNNPAQRPLGLTGNFSVNSALYIISLQYIIFCNSLDVKIKESRQMILLFSLLSIIGVVLAQSGTGYLIMVFFILTHAFNLYSFPRIILGVTISILSALLIGQIFSIGKLSGDYFFHNIDIIKNYLNELSNIDFLETITGVGIRGNIDTFITLVFSETGLLGIIFYAIFFISLYFRSSNHHGKIFVLILFLSSLRYPAIANQITQVLISFYFYIVFVMGSRRSYIER